MENHMRANFTDYTKRVEDIEIDEDSESLDHDVFFYGTDEFHDFMGRKTDQEREDILDESSRHAGLYKTRPTFTHPLSQRSLDESYDALLNDVIETYADERDVVAEEYSSDWKKGAVAGALTLLFTGTGLASLDRMLGTKVDEKYRNALNANQEIERINDDIDQVRDGGKNWGVEEPEEHPYFQSLKEKKDSILAEQGVDDRMGLEWKIMILDLDRKEKNVFAGLGAFVSILAATGTSAATFDYVKSYGRRRKEKEELDERIKEIKDTY